MKVGIASLGCKVNTYESEFVIQELKSNGYEIAPFDSVCDIYIINTCTVTNTSDIKSRKMIHQAIRRNPKACIVAMGCFIEANPTYDEEGVSLLIGNQDKGKIVSLIDEYFTLKKPIHHLVDQNLFVFESMNLKTAPGRTRAFVKIQDGCENFCSYCIIPFVRGKCRSKPFDLVIEEVNYLVRSGYQEIVLTGIHTGNYGSDINTNFADLLLALTKIDGLMRLRISSIEITELNDTVLKVLAQEKIIVNHLHIPLQAGSDDILKLMKRKYDLSYFRKKLKQIRTIRKDISITTDIIVGFPHETEEMFQQTLETAKEFAFAKIHVFPYSKRDKTLASTMEQVPNEVKKDRAKRLLALSRELEEEYMKKFMGKTLTVLIETTKEGYSYGHSENYLYAKIKGDIPSNTLIDLIVEKIEYPYVICRQ